MHIIWKQHNNYGDFGSLQTNLHLLRQKKTHCHFTSWKHFSQFIILCLVCTCLYYSFPLRVSYCRKKGKKFIIFCCLFAKIYELSSYELRLWISFESTNVNIKRSANDLFFRSFLDVCTRGVNNMKGNLQSSNQ